MKVLLKIVLIFFGLLMYLSFVQATDYDEELKRAKRENKPILLYFYNRYCPYCDMMERNVILDKSVKKIIDNHIVFVWIDGDKRKDLMRNYEVFGFPTVILLEPSGKPISSVPGYIHKENFLKILEYLKDGHYRKMSLKTYLQKKK
ncbi:MAG: thioredoxin family protein [Deltaproteobacteria bacterium]|nr:thioredoxin family protein [Deltaproteobacteria bacterium]